MSRGPGFTERQVFEQVLAQVPAADGTAYSDVRTIYLDMSRLVAAWLAKQSPEDINRLYNDLGWQGNANGRALHEAATYWMRTNHPDRAARSGNAPG